MKVLQWLCQIFRLPTRDEMEMEIAPMLPKSFYGDHKSHQPPEDDQPLTDKMESERGNR